MRPKSSSLLSKTGSQYDTGKAALLAYTNLDHVATEDLVSDNWHKSPNTRNAMISQTSADNSSKLIDGSIPLISTGVVSNVLNASGSTRRSDLKDSLRNITKFNKSNKSLIL